MKTSKSIIDACPNCGSVCISHGWLDGKGKTISHCFSCEKNYDPSKTNVITIKLPDNWCATQEGQSDCLILKNKNGNAKERVTITPSSKDWNWAFTEDGRVLINFEKE